MRSAFVTGQVLECPAEVSNHVVHLAEFLNYEGSVRDNIDTLEIVEH